MGTPGHTVYGHRATALKITFFSAPCSLWSSDIHSGALQSMSLSLSVRWIWQTRGGLVLLVALLGLWPYLRALLFCLRFCCHCHHLKRFLLIFNKWWSGGLAWLVAMFTRSVTSLPPAVCLHTLFLWWLIPLLLFEFYQDIFWGGSWYYS